MKMKHNLLTKLAWAALAVVVVSAGTFALLAQRQTQAGAGVPPPALAVSASVSGVGFRSMPGKLLGMAGTASRLDLYPAGGKGALAGASKISYLLPAGKAQIHIDEPGGLALDRYLHPGDNWVEFEIEYWAPDKATGKRLLKRATHFAASGAVVQEEAFRADGTRAASGMYLGAQGASDYRRRTYFGDGVRLASETVIGKSQKEYETQPVIVRQTKWHDNGGVALTNVLHSDSSRTVAVYDDAHNQLAVGHIADGIKGSEIHGYYPGTKTPRIIGGSNYEETFASVFRKDGTLSMYVILTASELAVTYYDTTGTRAQLYQAWAFTRAEHDGVVEMKNLRVFKVVEMDAQGQPAREWNLRNDHQLWSFYQYNQVVDGVNWYQVCNFYGMSGFLNEITYIPGLDAGVKKIVNVKEGERIAPVMPPANLLVRPAIDHILAVFAVPAPPEGEGP